MNLVEQVTAAWQAAGQAMERDLFREPVVVGVSGGPDSLALLHALGQVISAPNLIIAHLDHQLRPTSAEEAQFVVRIASTMAARCHVQREDISAFAQKSGLSIEEAGRVARYRFLAEVARWEGAALIAVGHHADDQVETILMNFLRGSGSAGLRGMPVLGGLPGAADLWLIRPLLDITRAEIESYCQHHNLSPRFDLSNIDTTYHRNRLRHELLPTLATYNPQVHRHLRQLAAIMTGEDDLLNRLAEDAWRSVGSVDGDGQVRLNRAGWQSHPLALRRRLLRHAANQIIPGMRNIGFRSVEAARTIAETGQTGSRINLPNGLEIRLDYTDLVISRGPVDLTSHYPQVAAKPSLYLAIPGSVDLAQGWRLTADRRRAMDLELIRQNRDPWQCFIAIPSDCELMVRSRQPGERIQPLGMESGTKIKEVMINRKIPASARNRWPIIATHSHPVWIVGHVLDERARVHDDNEWIVHLRCFREVNDSAEL